VAIKYQAGAKEKMIMKSRIIMLLVIFIVTLQTAGFAHAPKKILVDYNLDDSVVKITILHPTPRQIKHRIGRLIIELNDQEVVVQKFLKQKWPESQEAVFVIPSLKTGDKLTVVAHCSVFGKKKVNVEIQ
jgi:hypothetical protein